MMGQQMEMAQGIVGIGGVYFILALTDWVKTTFPRMPKRFYPSVAVCWGLFINVGWALVMLGAGLTQQHPVVIMAVGIVVGISTGLMASGLYSGSKAWKSREQ